MTTENNWEVVKALHSYKTGVSPIVVDLIAVQDILKYYATGLCVATISKSLKMDTAYVVETLEEFYPNSYKDIETDLKFNPYMFYKLAEDLNEYIVNTFIYISDEDELTRLYFVCTLYSRYEEILKNYEGN